MSELLICELCPRLCVIPEGASGDCRIRVNLDGKLYATTYGRPSAIHVDPIEKKPLFHFFPGTPIFSIATAGCNLHCANCQNWQLSQAGGHEMDVVYRAEPADVVRTAVAEGCRAIAYTYSEPLVFFEYTRDTAVLARQAGLRNVLVTAGFVNKPPLRALCQVLDGVTADIKSFDDQFYRRNCGGWLGPVLEALVTIRREGVWLEVSNLVIPTLTDDLASIRRLSRWICTELGAGTPLHFLRFRPQYKMRNLPPTPAETLENARKEAMEAGLEYVYIGNVAGHDSECTRCPRDGTMLVRRVGYQVVEIGVKEGRCPTCGHEVPGRWVG
ncbi:MAG: AmmeMemoRadiSam system radical SAM enzyme [Pseudomonadota bacterium]